MAVRAPRKETHGVAEFILREPRPCDTHDDLNPIRPDSGTRSAAWHRCGTQLWQRPKGRQQGSGHSGCGVRSCSRLTCIFVMERGCFPVRCAL
jgi:hypothetical protein